MEWLVAVLLVVGVVAACVTLVFARWHGSRDEHVGVLEFQREMRALSTEADRQVVDDGGVRIIGRPTDEV